MSMYGGTDGQIMSFAYQGATFAVKTSLELFKFFRQVAIEHAIKSAKKTILDGGEVGLEKLKKTMLVAGEESFSFSVPITSVDTIRKACEEKHIFFAQEVVQSSVGNNFGTFYVAGRYAEAFKQILKDNNLNDIEGEKMNNGSEADRMKEIGNQTDNPDIDKIADNMKKEEAGEALEEKQKAEITDLTSDVAEIDKKFEDNPELVNEPDLDPAQADILPEETGPVVTPLGKTTEEPQPEPVKKAETEPINQEFVVRTENAKRKEQARKDQFNGKSPVDKENREAFDKAGKIPLEQVDPGRDFDIKNLQIDPKLNELSLEDRLNPMKALAGDITKFRKFAFAGIQTESMILYACLPPTGNVRNGQYINWDVASKIMAVDNFSGRRGVKDKIKYDVLNFKKKDGAYLLAYKLVEANPDLYATLPHKFKLSDKLINLAVKNPDNILHVPSGGFAHHFDHYLADCILQKPELLTSIPLQKNFKSQIETFKETYKEVSSSGSKIEGVKVAMSTFFKTGVSPELFDRALLKYTSDILKDGKVTPQEIRNLGNFLKAVKENVLKQDADLTDGEPLDTSIANHYMQKMQKMLFNVNEKYRLDATRGGKDVTAILEELGRLNRDIGFDFNKGEEGRTK